MKMESDRNSTLLSFQKKNTRFWNACEKYEHENETRDRNISERVKFWLAKSVSPFAFAVRKQIIMPAVQIALLG